ncbi:Alpha-1,3-mannosyl-glycoprotein 4-beta-N-acetylglucosaminyltransferase C [Branchiostoma belcheri]|nr:Alpha-1,3-mannosyl-glycoprotein 4-beta-N-acetylglucosaminyltransferase C [Branchiostoma belcheri]
MSPSSRPEVSLQCHSKPPGTPKSNELETEETGKIMLLSRVRMLFVRQVVLVCMVVSMFLNFWMLTGTELQNETAHVDLQKAVQTCELQREMLIDSLATMNDTLRRESAKLEQKNNTSPPPANSGRPTVAVTDSVLIAGRQRQHKGFLTIGVPTVKRDQNAMYLVTTLDSLINHTTEAERKQIVIVVFLADFDKDYNKDISSEISRRYPQHLNTGFMQVIQAPRSFYPTFEELKRKFRDSLERILWRSKQCVDYAFLFQYCRNMSEYYLQLEDDVISAENFLSSIKTYLDRVRLDAWTALEFSELGFIGKLFKSSDLQLLSGLFKLFYQELPVDILLHAFIRIVQPTWKKFKHKPSLFQHVGLHSSLRGKRQELIDKEFVDSNNDTTKVQQPS